MKKRIILARIINPPLLCNHPTKMAPFPKESALRIPYHPLRTSRPKKTKTCWVSPQQSQTSKQKLLPKKSTTLRWPICRKVSKSARNTST